MGACGQPVDKSLYDKILQEFVEETGRFLGLVKKKLMNRCGNVCDGFLSLDFGPVKYASLSLRELHGATLKELGYWMPKIG